MIPLVEAHRYTVLQICTIKVQYITTHPAPTTNSPPTHPAHTIHLVHQHIERRLGMRGGETASRSTRARNGILSWARNLAGRVPDILITIHNACLVRNVRKAKLTRKAEAKK